MFYIRLLTLLTPLATFFLFELFFFYPKMVYVSLVLVNLAIFFTVWQFSKISFLDKKWWNYLILPLFFSTGLAAYSVVLSSGIAIHFLFVLDVFFLYFYFRSVYYYLTQSPLHKESAFENISSYGNFLAFFFGASAVFSLQSFLNTPIWLLTVILIIYSSFLIYQALWALKIDSKRSLIYILINCFVLAELGWTISFLPINFNSAGLALAVCYYMLAGMTRFYLLERLNKKIIKLYLSAGLSSIIIVLLSARWM